MNAVFTSGLQIIGTNAAFELAVGKKYTLFESKNVYVNQTNAYTVISL